MICTVDKDMAKKGLKEIFIDKLNIDFDKLLKDHPDCLNYNVFGRYIQLAPRDMLYIFFEVEKVFEMEIPEQAILNGFNTFNNILNCITKA